MDKFIEALQILKKYRNLDNPFYAGHDIINFYEITPDEVSTEDKKRLEELDIYHDDSSFYYYTYSSSYYYLGAKAK